MARERTPLEQAEKRISDAWWLALISAGVTVVLAFISIGGEPIAGIDELAFIDVVLILGLAFGLSRKSRACAVVLLLYFAAGKIYMWTESGTLRGAPVALLFMFYFARGVVGTFQYHELIGSAAEQPAYRPAGASAGTPWLVWMILASVLLAAAGAGWHFKPSRQLEEASARGPTMQDIESSLSAAVGRLSSVEMNGKVSALSAAIAVDEGIMLVPCRGITSGSPLFVKLASQDVQAKLEAIDQGTGLCKLTVKDRASWPLKKAAAAPKVGDAVFAAGFDPSGRVVVSHGEVRKVSTGPRGLVIESSARSVAAVDGSPLLDAKGRVVGISLEGQDTALPAEWAAQWPDN